MAPQPKVLDALGGGHTDAMSDDDQGAFARLDLFIARLEEFRDLAVNGIIDAELAYRASQDRTGLACCWCGYDLTEHDDEAGHREVATRTRSGPQGRSRSHGCCMCPGRADRSRTTTPGRPTSKGSASDAGSKRGEREDARGKLSRSIGRPIWLLNSIMPTEQVPGTVTSLNGSDPGPEHRSGDWAAS